MNISVRLPGRRAADPRVTVTLRERGTPWPVRFHFLNLLDDETGVAEYVHVGFELGERYDDVESGIPLKTEPEALDPVSVQRIAKNYVHYLELARQAIVLDQEGIGGAIRRLRPGRKAARLTDDFYRLVADDFAARQQASSAPMRELAEAHHVDISTASRWVKEARRRGFLEEADG